MGIVICEEAGSGEISQQRERVIYWHAKLTLRKIRSWFVTLEEDSIASSE